MIRKYLRLVLAGAPMALAAGHVHAQSEIPANLEQAGGIEALAELAKAEGNLLVYGAPSQDKFEVWVRDFEQQYGIDVQYYRGPTNTIFQRFVQEQRSGRNQADIVALSDLTVIETGEEAGYIASYTPQNAALFPENMRKDAIAYPLFLTVSTVGWNTRVVPEDLQKALFEDPLAALLDPRLKGKIAVVDVTAGGPQLATSANLVYNLEDQYGWEYLEKLAAQDPAIIRTSPVVLDGVIAGDYWATTDAYTSLFAAQAVNGAPIAFQAPDTAAASIFYTSVAENAPNPHAARLFTEWATSLEAQNSLAEITEGDVVIEGWEDRRKVSRFDWYRPASTLYVEWQSDERFRDEELRSFYARWAEVYGQ
ncbi:extracellular solute-binding protein [Aquamicrobium sp. LC103]|uniref:ABC transporter substrate-binding protein n=1 Tax=Aquamicrobium sp. LC103 TaxID=1120658 RepID=UPI00063E7349|nr:extracellular solute-binding protein [Aquamicrobium sp. LC103]TKT69799.1 extracellular solute-binding protein [Aquamicrobium sp. LC103]